MTKLNLFSNASFLLTAIVGLTLGACDLGPKMIGEETQGGGDCKNGDMMKSDDNCNDCTCVDGAWACTEKACDDTGPAPTCEQGETKPAPDNCNTCTCDQGAWACTELGCVPDECKPGETKMDDCNSCNCSEGLWACTAIYCGGACGDGVVDPDEKCDDGNKVDDDQCPNDCGVVGGTGDPNDTDGTTADPEDTDSGTGTGETGEPGLCGDGIVSGGEQCDDGNLVDDDDCSNACTLGGNVCGPKDPNTIGDAVIDGDTLSVEVTYGGGCEPHDFGLCWDGVFAESFPVQAWVSLSHDAHGDICDALLTEVRPIDLSGLKKAYQEGYQTQNGTIKIHLDGWDKLIDYTF